MASTRSPSTFTHKHTHLKICHKYTWVYKKKITNTIPTIVLPRRRTMRDYTAQSPDYTREMNGSMDNQRRDKTLGAHTSHQFCFTSVCVCVVWCVCLNIAGWVALHWRFVVVVMGPNIGDRAKELLCDVCMTTTHDDKLASHKSVFRRARLRSTSRRVTFPRSRHPAEKTRAHHTHTK